MNTILYMGAGGSLLILGVVILRRLFLQKLPKYFFVVLWLIALTRLFVPVSIPVRWPPAAGRLEAAMKDHWKEAAGQSTDGGYAVEKSAGAPAAAAGRYTAADRRTGFEGNASKRLRFLLAAIWLCGITITATVLLINHIKWLKRYAMSLPYTDSAVTTWQSHVSGRRNIKIRCSDQISGPLTYGLFKPVILLPSGCIWENEDELFCIMAHEYIHIMRFDIAIKYAMYAAACIYWFNPLVWIMAHLLSRDLELSCDEAVIRRLDCLSKRDYALLLIRQAEKQTVSAPTGVCFSRCTEMEERIESIMKSKRYPSKLLVPAAAIVFCMMTAFTVSAGDHDTAKPGAVSAAAAVETAPGSSNADSNSKRPADSPSAAAQKSTPSVTGGDIVKLALDHVGDPYEFGGTNFETGVDCSGFVMAVYKEFGITLPHETAELAGKGIPFTSDSPAKGDVVLYTKINADHAESPDHSAIYIGDGKVIHASNKKEGVKISEIDYRSPYKVVRILNQTN